MKLWSTLIIYIVSINHVLAENTLEQMTVIGEKLFSDTTAVSPTSTITADDLQSTNLITVEDSITYEPSLIVRRRFIGDPNGVIGIRGSNMFQNTRSLVFTDGMPVHYHLQTQYSGSPRWSLVSTGEIDKVEVIYGPFSAEYSGNSMGGVVNITTKIPTEQRIRIESTLFNQEYDALEINDAYQGGKVFFSYENKPDNITVFFSYNHLQNNSQPQTQFYDNGFVPDMNSAEDVAIVNSSVEIGSGTITSIDDSNNDVLYFGDSGPEKATTDLLKLKLGYDLGKYQWRGSIAYEQRQREEFRSQNYLRDSSGSMTYERYFTLASDTTGRIYDTTSYGTSVFQNRELERNSLLLGFGLSGFLSNDSWVFDSYYSNFQILDDKEIRSAANPNDPNYIVANNAFRGRLTEFDNTGWQIFDFKIGTENLAANDMMRLSLGYHYDLYELEIHPKRYNSITGELGSARDSSGGKTSTQALFAQFGYAISVKWDLALGIRYEAWQSKDGFFGVAGDDDYISIQSRSETGSSPKFSIAYFPTDSVQWRYSLARALRFPVVEELFRNESSGIRQVINDATLKPEDGIHHNFSFEKLNDNGSLKINAFHEIIEDVIFNYTETSNNTNITTSLPVDEVTTQGLEFIYNQQGLFDSKYDIRFNLTYTNSEITENSLNPSFIGNDFPRMPKWRSNLIIKYNINDTFNLNGSIRYASDSSGRLDNTDTAEGVFGAHDSFTFLNIKANWEPIENMLLSFGIDNLNNQEAYVHHPWPMRTYFLEAKFEL